MRIAIIGAGLSGLAVAYHMLRREGSLEIQVFDPAGIGGGASGIAAGLMHPYAGAHAKLSWRAHEGMRATRELLEVSSKSLDVPVFSDSGLLRIAVTEEQQYDFSLCAARHSDVQLLTAEQCKNLIPGVIAREGLLVKSAITIDPSLYLKGLWSACSAFSIKLEKRAIKSLAELTDFDQIIVTMGASCTSLPELKHLPLTPIKGQILELAWPEGLPDLPMPINSQAYLVQNPKTHTCFAGATFERQFDSSEPDISVASREIMPKVAAFLAALEGAKILGCRAGIRASAPHHRPLVTRVNTRCWVLTGMGSKGLLYHALCAKELVDIVDEVD